MDEAFMARFEEWFRETSRQIAALGEETSARFDQVERRLDQNEQRFDQVEQRFDQVEQRFDQVEQRFDQVERRLDQNEETARHTLVLMESMRDEFRLVAEAYLGVNERVERYHSQSALTFEQVAGLVQPFFRDMDRRLNTLENWKERQEGDVLDAVRMLLERLSLQRAAKAST